MADFGREFETRFDTKFKGLNLACAELRNLVITVNSGSENAAKKFGEAQDGIIAKIDRNCQDADGQLGNLRGQLDQLAMGVGNLKSGVVNLKSEVETGNLRQTGIKESLLDLSGKYETVHEKFLGLERTQFKHCTSSGGLSIMDRRNNYFEDFDLPDTLKDPASAKKSIGSIEKTRSPRTFKPVNTTQPKFDVIEPGNSTLQLQPHSQCQSHEKKSSKRGHLHVCNIMPSGG